MASYPVPPIVVSGPVPAPSETVLAFVADTRNDPLWCSNVETVEMLTSEPVRVGSKFRFHQHLDRPGGKRLQFDVDVEITALDDRSVTWRVDDRLQERVITITVTPTTGGSMVTQTTRASFKRSPGMTRWVYPVLARRIFKDQLSRLADIYAGTGAA
ncbi:MAG TPA: SRPBCC family protein [Acidimicrobiia bacterium]